MEPSEKKARLLVQQQGDITVVSFLDQRILDPQTIDEITAELMALGQDTFKARILVSFENVEYLSSTVLGKLVALRKKVGEGKGILKLCCIKPTIREVFKITKLDRIFEIYDDFVSAVNSFRQKKFG